MRLRLSAIAMSAAVLATGCGADSDAASDSTEPTASASNGQNEPDEDTSLQDALSAAGVSDALVAELGRVAGAAGYGAQPGAPLTGDNAIRFAFAQRETCRELASGFRTLDEVVARDIADGASPASAQDLADFLGGTYCPAVSPTEDTSPPSPGPGSATPPTDGTRGLMSPVEFLDATLAAGSLTQCAAATGESYGEPRAYTLSGGQLVCASVNDTWDRHVVGFDVVFAPPVPVAQALPVIEVLLPEDIGQPDTVASENPSWSPVQGGCLNVAWPSPTIGAAVARLSTNFEDTNAATAVLYADRQTSEGASAPFEGLVRVASVGFGSHPESELDISC